jgi:hypothetical protein
MAIVYIHRRKDIQDPFLNIFYVGIGKTEKRAYQINNRGNSSYWHNIVKKHGHIVEITHKDILWEEACSIEKYLISFYGRYDKKEGKLCNLTDGGDGTLGAIRSQKYKDNLKLKLTGLKRSPETIEKLRLKQIGFKMPESAKIKISIANKGKLISAEHKKRLREYNKGKFVSKETREKLRIINTGKKLTQEHKDKIGVHFKGEKNPMYGVRLTGSKNSMYGRRGKLAPSARKVCQYSLTGELIATFDTVKEAALACGLDPRRISENCRNQRPKRKNKYKWEYIN